MLKGFDLTGRTAIVTGGGTGIGRVTALMMAERGADIVVSGRRPEPIQKVAEEVRALGRRAIAVPTDVCDRESAKALIDATIKEFGKLDILINNAGGPYGQVGLGKMDLDWWDRDVSLNLSSAMYVSQAALPHLRETKGNIVNVSSMAGVNGTVGVGAYSAAKAGLQMLTRVMSGEWGRYGIRVNCVAPGMTATEAAYEGWEKHGYDAAEASKHAFSLGRYGTTEELAQAIVFFASDAASYITGETLAVCGGTQVSGMVDPEAEGHVGGW
jgi:NAD(P)-dependent dehydrogenase (short-subunit alcohol dehydrogenase family)